MSNHTLSDRFAASLPLLTLALVGSSSALAVVAPVPTAPKSDPVLTSLARFGAAVNRRILSNGLSIVLDEDHTTPTVAVSVTYGVGSSSELVGRTGFAHLFEHMMFQGSRHAAKGEHFKLISGQGGDLNGTTNSDRTNYYEVLPSNDLELALWLEADRMRWLAVTPENLENQRAVVQEEYRMRVMNQPYAAGMIRLEEIVFASYAPYAHDTIGSMADLNAARFEWIKDFHERHYAPNNAVLTIAGDFDPTRAMQLVSRYFGPAERKDVPSTALPPIPEQPRTGQAVVQDDNARTPGFAYGFMIPPSRTADHYALELLTLILADGESSRLYTSLVHDRAVAENVSAWTEGHRGPDQLSVMAVLTDKGRLSEVEAAVDAELARLQHAPPSLAELEKAQRQLRQRFVFGLQTNLSRAIELGEFESLWGDARQLPDELVRYLEVTPQAVQQAARRYLKRERRSLVEIMPARTGAPR
jgi:zinc protease